MTPQSDDPQPSTDERLCFLEEYVKKLSTDEQYVCWQAGTSEELKDEMQGLKENQELIQGNLAGLNVAINSVRDSQHRMYEMIEGVIALNQQFKEYMVKKDTQNGFRDKEVEEMKDCLDTKASKQDVADNKKSTHDWVKQIAKNQEKQDEKIFRLMLGLVLGLLAISGSIIVLYLTNLI